MTRITPTASKPASVGFVQLLVEYAEIRRFLSQSAVRRRGEKGKRLGVSLPAESGSRLFLDPHLGRHVSRKGQRNARVRHERRLHRSRFAKKYRRSQESRIGWSSARFIPDETSEFWRSPGITPEEMKTINTDRLSSPLRRIRREGRHVHQLGPLVGLEGRRRAAAGRVPARSGHPGANFPSRFATFTRPKAASSRIRF